MDAYKEFKELNKNDIKFRAFADDNFNIEQNARLFLLPKRKEEIKNAEDMEYMNNLYTLESNLKFINRNVDLIDLYPESNVANLIRAYKNDKRNRKLFGGDLIQWTDPEPNIHNNHHTFRNSIYRNIKKTIYGMELTGVKIDDKIFRTYLNSTEFEWYNNEYTIYANGRDKKEDEEENTLGNQLNDIVDAVYYNDKDMNTEKLKPGEFEWRGAFIGKDVAIDLAIKWERNQWASLAANDTTERWSGKVISGPIVLSSISKTFDAPQDFEAKNLLLRDYFKNKNTINFYDKYNEEHKINHFLRIYGKYQKLFKFIDEFKDDERYEKLFNDDEKYQELIHFIDEIKGN